MWLIFAWLFAVAGFTLWVLWMILKAVVWLLFALLLGLTKLLAAASLAQQRRRSA